METYNEKQIKLNREINAMREQAHQSFNAKRVELARLKEETGHVFEQEKKRLAEQLNDCLMARLEMKSTGFECTHIRMRENYENERRIHELQNANRNAFLGKLRDIARQNNENTEQYRAEKMKIANYKAERLLQIEREECERKLLSLQNEETKD